MKTIKYLAISLLAMAGASCAKEAYVGDVSSKLKLTFNVENEAATKSFLESRQVKWSEGDAVNIYDDIAGKLTESFTIVSNKVSANVSAGATKFFSLYPYDKNSEFAENKITTVLPAKQRAKAGSFANGANVAVAYTEISSPSLTYANLGTLVKFTLDEDDVQSVNFLGRSGEAVAGKVKIDYNGGNPTYETLSAETSVELSNSDKSALAKGGIYYMVVLPQTFSKGISLILTKTDGTFAVKSSSASVNFARNEITDLGTISGLSFAKDRYALYQAGMTLSIGGADFSKAVNGDAKLVKSSENGANIIATISNHPGVYFLDDDANTGFNMEAEKTLVSTGNTAIFSRNADTRIKLKPYSKSSISITAETFAVERIDFDLSEIGAKLSHNTKATSDIDNIIFEDCVFHSLSRPLINTGKSVSSGISGITFNKCRFFPEANANFVSYNDSEVLYKLNNFTFTNNVVCSGKPIQITSLIHYKDAVVDYSSAGAEVWNTKVNASHNIFCNVLAKSGYIHLYSVKHEEDACIMKHNVFTASESTALAGSCFALYDKKLDMTEKGKFVRVRDGVYDTSFLSKLKPSFNPKKYYDSGETTLFRKMFDIKGAPSAVFETSDLATGSFVMKEGYKQFGPQE